MGGRWGGSVDGQGSAQSADDPTHLTRDNALHLRVPFLMWFANRTAAETMCSYPPWYGNRWQVLVYGRLSDEFAARVDAHGPPQVEWIPKLLAETADHVGVVLPWHHDRLAALVGPAGVVSEHWLSR